MALGGRNLGLIVAGGVVLAGCVGPVPVGLHTAASTAVPGANGKDYAFNVDSAVAFTKNSWKTKNGNDLALNCPQSGTIQAKQGDTVTCTYVDANGYFGILVLTVGVNQAFTYRPAKTHLWFAGVLNDIRTQYQQKNRTNLAVACPNYHAIITFTGPQKILCSYTDSLNQTGTLSIAITALPDVYTWRAAPTPQAIPTATGTSRSVPVTG